jgi:hypothetical protein
MRTLYSMQVDVIKASPPTSMMKMITHHLHQGARKWEKDKNAIQRRKPFLGMLTTLHQLVWVKGTNPSSSRQ